MELEDVRNEMDIKGNILAKFARKMNYSCLIHLGILIRVSLQYPDEYSRFKWAITGVHVKFGEHILSDDITVGEIRAENSGEIILLLSSNEPELDKRRVGGGFQNYATDPASGKVINVDRYYKRYPLRFARVHLGEDQSIILAAKAEAERIAREEAAEAERIAREEAERIAREEAAEAERIARELAAAAAAEKAQKEAAEKAAQDEAKKNKKRASLTSHIVKENSTLLKPAVRGEPYSY